MAEPVCHWHETLVPDMQRVILDMLGPLEWALLARTDRRTRAMALPRLDGLPAKEHKFSVLLVCYANVHLLQAYSRHLHERIPDDPARFDGQWLGDGAARRGDLNALQWIRTVQWPNISKLSGKQPGLIYYEGSSRFADFRAAVASGDRATISWTLARLKWNMRSATADDRPGAVVLRVNDQLALTKFPDDVALLEWLEKQLGRSTKLLHRVRYNHQILHAAVALGHTHTVQWLLEQRFSTMLDSMNVYHLYALTNVACAAGNMTVLRRVAPVLRPFIMGRPDPDFVSVVTSIWTAAAGAPNYPEVMTFLHTTFDMAWHKECFEYLLREWSFDNPEILPVLVWLLKQPWSYDPSMVRRVLAKLKPNLAEQMAAARPHLEAADPRFWALWCES